MKKVNRIFITGASGTGKTTLAKHISEEYGIPFISSSAKEIWPNFGFTEHRQCLRICLANPLIGLEYQKAVLQNRYQKLYGKTRFVTDRSPWDNYAYFLLQQGYLNPSDNQSFRESCLGHVALADLTIFLRTNDQMVLEDDGKRIVNLEYQRLVDHTLDFIIEEGIYDIDAIVFETTSWNFEERKEFVKEIING